VYSNTAVEDIGYVHKGVVYLCVITDVPALPDPNYVPMYARFILGTFFRDN